MNFNSVTEGEFLILTLEGDLIGEDNGLDIVEKANESIESGINKCIVDISDLRYINSSGIGVLITLLTKFRNKGGEVVLVNPSESVKKLLIITKLNAIFTVKETVVEAKNSLSSNE